jgi:SAM-dependent methyltransferase
MSPSTIRMTVEAAMSTRQATYAFDNARQIQLERLRALEDALDPGTIRHLEACGATAGWRCLEIGAGGGSIANWLCERVRPGGSVIATDLDTTVLRAQAHRDVDVREHDVLADAFPPASFDLIHCRLVLAWLPHRREALTRICGWLKPGGWLLAEEMDFVSAIAVGSPSPDATRRFERVIQAHLHALSARHGFDPGYGRQLPTDLELAGVTPVGCEGRVSVWRGGASGMRVWRITFAQLADAMIELGTDAADIDRAIALSDDPRMSCLSPLVMAAWGRVPN